MYNGSSTSFYGWKKKWQDIIGGISAVLQQQHLQNSLPDIEWDRAKHMDTMEEVWGQLDKNAKPEVVINEVLQSL